MPLIIDTVTNVMTYLPTLKRNGVRAVIGRVLKGPPVKLTHGLARTKMAPTSVPTAPTFIHPGARRAWQLS
jgi:hypothetical protein